jgi:D-alanyl-D-alanine carboxypeptidase (penicillin-binding protein 5/6)
MAAPDTKTRFAEASKLLNYGFANYSIYTDDNADTALTPVKVTKGVLDTVNGKAKNIYSYLCVKGRKAEDIHKEIVLYDEVQAPVALNDKIGEIVYYYDNEKIGSVDILASQAVNKAKYKDYFLKLIKRYFVGHNKKES